MIPFYSYTKHSLQQLCYIILQKESLYYIILYYEGQINTTGI
jgi:hypothetical protein